jgi:hypothetical protein
MMAVRPSSFPEPLYEARMTSGLGYGGEVGDIAREGGEVSGAGARFHRARAAAPAALVAADARPARTCISASIPGIASCLEPPGSSVSVSAMAASPALGRFASVDIAAVLVLCEN